QSAGIFTVVSIIHPAPMETRESRRETMEFLKDVRPDSVLVQFPGIYPGTPWFEQAERFGFSLDREKYPRQVMGYQIKSLFPPRYWRPLPYLINGMPFRVFARETELFQEELNRSGILTGVSDEAYLLFQAASPGSLEAFIRNNRCWFYAGDARRLTEEIDTINRGSG
ncbi:MAG TPA: hypothetical protein PK644_10835, partial [bacterium]|nr:hypothetical protein [bacterium]